MAMSAEIRFTVGHYDNNILKKNVFNQRSILNYNLARICEYLDRHVDIRSMSLNWRKI